MSAWLKNVEGALLAAALCVGVAAGAMAADLIGHGGPVRGIALSADGSVAVTASFDSTLIRWSVGSGAARQVMRFHQGAVNAVVMLPDGRMASAGEDGRIALWRAGEALPAVVLEGHSAPVSALAISPDGGMLASASWDGTARLWPLAGGAAGGAGRILLDHKANVNGVGFLADGTVVTAAYDGAVRLFGAQTIVRMLDAPLSALVIAGDEIIVAGADGRLRCLTSSGEMAGEVVVAEMPLSTLAVSRDERRVATAGFRGTLAIVDRASRRIERKLEGPAFPVWSLAFSADGAALLTGGANRIVRQWSVATGEPLSPVEPGADDGVPSGLQSHPGAEIFRACSACHTLTTRAGNRAGPSLAGLFGRRIGSAAGYDFSPALKALDIVWSDETVQKLFEIGPMAYTPGTKMPEQKIIRAEDRQALTDFLRAAQGR